MPKVGFRKEVVNVALADLLEQRGLSEGNVVDGKVVGGTSIRSENGSFGFVPLM
jgi:hypothetical protein